ncbi:hypothetical protein CKO15_01085 [Halorhodospira abdelmalekii]|uniref:sulfotransferase family 2 domain-containing protein n=1 Tax=Halorhodospira abdelmalekii TaxID=421629 RepID=UPI0019078CCE|nr:sulfotransferase family 2 domain-containing protein [Halorhodospira abdelmalekii]MBK1733895.1 hypothetical protein [Halorhodospira abdelmalekii]
MPNPAPRAHRLLRVTLPKLGKDARCSLTPYYRSRPETWRRQLGSIDARIAVSLHYKYTYIRIPKAANSTVAATLDHHFPAPPIPRISGKERGRGKRSYDRLSSLSRAEAEQVLAEHFTFTVVRNPYHRVLSAFLQKFIAEGSSRERWLNRFAAEIRTYGGGELTFPAFCRWLDRVGLRQNIHWLPQTAILSVTGLERLDDMGHVETLEEDLRRIVERIGATPEGLEVQRSGPAATRAGQKAQQYYTDECMAIVRRLYADDFRHLGYRDDTLA